MYNAKQARELTKSATDENTIISNLIDTAISNGNFSITRAVSKQMFDSLILAGYKLSPSTFKTHLTPVVISWQ